MDSRLLVIVSLVLIGFGISLIILSKKLHNKPITYGWGMKSRDSFFLSTKKLSKAESSKIRRNFGIILLVLGLIIMIITIFQYLTQKL